MELAGVLMAGGKSSRMGRDKGFAVYKGKMMASFGLDILVNSCQKCFISTNNPRYKLFNLPLIADIYAEIGPLGGVHAALVNSPFQHIVVLGCDLPNINTDVIELLKKNIHNADAVIPIHNTDKSEPLVAIYSKSILPLLEEMIQKKDYKMHRLLKNANSSFISMDPLILKHPKLFQNINTVDQLSK